MQFFHIVCALVLTAGISASNVAAQPVLVPSNRVDGSAASIAAAKPLDALTIIGAPGERLIVTDGRGRAYVSAKATTPLHFVVGGNLGTHIVSFYDKKGQKISSIPFAVGAVTTIDDGGRYKDMFDLFFTSMQTDTGFVRWNGTKYRYFVPWGLDHCHTMKGLKYFYNFGTEFVDLMRQVQREDGMIWSFVQTQTNMDYWRTRDAWSGYTKKIGDLYFVRQPTENHPEYIYVNTIYQCWKATGDDAWMKKNLASAESALNYGMTDPARWSKRFGLLKRVYTIDSWDFQVEDKYLPDLGITNSMVVDPVKSKFGIFFGDNTGYITACRELAEMYAQAGMTDKAGVFASRADEFTRRLDALAWNGRFYNHFIEEDSTVKRDLGVDEKSQLAQSNAYSVNRGLPHDKNKAIIESYLTLKQNLPLGSPGEWYSIYPPFGKGFDVHNTKWQYMNGGVGGHVAGELARGAFESGYEAYGADILERMYELGKRHDNKIYFSYTGALFPPPPPPSYKPLNLLSYANMDTWAPSGKQALPWINSKRDGDDIRNLPTGERDFGGIRFRVIDPASNGRKAAIGVSQRKGYPPYVEIPVKQTAGAVYLLHTSTHPSSENVAGAVTLRYNDGTSTTQYMLQGKHLTYWWFSRLNTERSGIAWYGDNAVSKGIGISWCAIDNPHPEKPIASIVLHAAADETIYTVLGITLSDQKHYIPVNPVSFGGPDNWSAATNMAALIEGLAGIKDAPAAEAFSKPLFAPRWIESKTDSVYTVVRYAASSGYVAYKFLHDRKARQLTWTITGSGDNIRCHLLLPQGVRTPRAIRVDGKEINYTRATVEQSTYVDFDLALTGAKNITVDY